MIIGMIKLTVHIPWAHSLKEKRMVIKSLIEKTKNKYNVSIAEVEISDLHQLAVIGISFVGIDGVHAQQLADNIIDYIEASTDAQINMVETDIFAFGDENK